MHRRAVLPALAGLSLLSRHSRAQGLSQQPWVPDRPIRLVVGFAAGGSTDTAARILAQAISPGLGQTVLVENRTGAGGNVASEAVARSAPDGQTLVMASMGTHAVNQTLYRSLPFHVARDFAPVSLMVFSTSVVVVHPSLPVRTMTELITLAKARPGGLNCGTGGSGSSQHFAAAQFEEAAKVKFALVHYRGGAPANADLISGRVDVVFSPIIEAIQQIRAGQMRAIGVTSPERSALMPEIPTVAEALPGFIFRSWLGVLAPAGTPIPVITRLSAEIQAAMRVPAMRERVASLGYEAVGSTAEEFAEFQVREIARTAELVKISGATVD
ncbi:Bug family tripartite tricarboxylate transporter substrate binding protein [Belnapia moabensis]|uniref:Bug family tripartite tricarboxylate transporter substrate binding protein n=1 Tax=Belnapia moabensis TaxID=365533 RepID=UPI0005BE4055|nr:tripartite tricarboxylate transporter substrate binding protein [Belnapia moabensis]